MDWQKRYQELAGANDVIARAVDELRLSLRNAARADVKNDSLFDLVVNYFSRQDDKFYQALKIRHQNNPSALKIIDFFIQDLKSIRVRLFILEEVNWNGRKQGYQQRVDIRELLNDLADRLQTERSQLFVLVAPDGTPIAS